MAKPKSVSIKPVKVEYESVDIKGNQSDNSNLEEKLNEHISNKNIHVDEEFKDSVSQLRKDIDSHVSKTSIHVTETEKETWNAKETPNGAQAKVNKVIESLTNHKIDNTVHVTQLEKEIFKDKYTRSETRNLLKHALTGLIFLESVNVRSELDTKYPNPEFNSCVYIKTEDVNVIFNGEKWITVNLKLSPEVTIESNGLMSKEDKIKLDSIEEGSNKYIHPDNVDVRHVSDSQIDYWNKKAESTLSTKLEDGLMSKEDKIKLDSIEEGSNKYIHPENHPATMITEDETHRFVSDEDKTKWDGKTDQKYVDDADSKVLATAKSFTDTKVASLMNSSEEQLQVLRSLSFELKKDDVVKQFFDLFNKCVKSKEFQDHSLNSEIHMTKSDKNLLNTVYEALNSGLNPDWNETNASSIRYINNKPTSLPANGGNADTVGGYTAQQLLSNKNFYDYTIGTSNYSLDTVSVLANENAIIDTINDIINKINKCQGYSILFRPGSYLINNELIIKASNITITGIGTISKLLDASIKIIGNNNMIENITFENSSNTIVNKTAIYVEGNNNIIRCNTIMNYNDGIIVEGSNNTVILNSLVNIRNNAIKLSADNNSNYGNTIDNNSIKNSNMGVNLTSSKNSLYRNYVTKNKVFNCSIGIVLSNTISDTTKTISNIINENIVIRGRGESSEYLSNHKTIVSEFSSKNIISSNITLGKEIIAPNDILTNNIF